MTRHALFVLLLAGCTATPPPPPPGETITELVIKPADKVDILFMVDNSPSMAPKLAELRKRFPELVQSMMKTGGAEPAHYHIGVITSDLGAGQFVLGGGQCRPGGDGGKLQAIGAAAPEGCLAPAGGLPFIDFDARSGVGNLPDGQDLATTFGCMAAVGEQGCGFEQPLESVYQALSGQVPENAGFLRPDALLVVALLTDEDDCSTPPDSNLFDPARTSEYGPLLSYRCSRWGIAYGADAQLLPDGPSNGPLPLARPAEAPLSKLYGVQRYIDLFQQQHAIVVSIAAPPQPVETLLADVSSSGANVPCAGPADGTCAVVLQHSCASATTPHVFGDPAVRIAAVTQAVSTHQSSSICDDSYGPAMQDMGNMLGQAQLGNRCLSQPLADPAHPDCTVEERVFLADGVASTRALPACAAGGAVPCWRLAPAAGCPALLGIDRGGAPAPDAVVTARCRTLLP